LRIRGAESFLDASAVHPESYPVVEAMASDLGCTVSDLMTSAELREKNYTEKLCQRHHRHADSHGYHE